ncbi:MAG TPA: HAD family phosphatase [Jatrophihabitantaceae bacterium]
MGLRLEAVLFDMDGTLVDTEPYWIAAEYALVESFGGTWSDAHAHALVGNALIDSAIYIREHGGVDMDPPDIVERLLDDVVIATEKEIPWRPGARELLASLAERGVPCALVTMSYARLADTMTAQLPPGTFAAVVTGDQVSDGKPHPEAYLTAAARLGADPRMCVAIEDSTTGIASATAAGCVVIGIPHHVTVTAEASVRIVDSLTNLSVDKLDEFVRDR